MVIARSRLDYINFSVLHCRLCCRLELKEPREGGGGGYLQALRDEDTSGGKHGPASVQELESAVLLHLLLVLAQT